MPPRDSDLKEVGGLVGLVQVGPPERHEPAGPLSRPLQNRVIPARPGQQHGHVDVVLGHELVHAGVGVLVDVDDIGHGRSPVRKSCYLLRCCYIAQRWQDKQQVRTALLPAVAAAETRHRDASRFGAQELPVHLALQSLPPRPHSDADDVRLRAGEQVVDVPAPRLALAKVPGDPGGGIAPGAAGVDVLAGGEVMDAQRPDAHADRSVEADAELINDRLVGGD